MKPEKFLLDLEQAGFGPYMGVPCSLFKHLINYIEDSNSYQYFAASSEGEAMGLAGGFALSTKMPVVLMQNDGYGNAVNPLSSLQMLYGLPCLLLVSWRGEPGKKDAPQHELMGETLLDFFKIFKIPYKILDPDMDDFFNIIQEAKNHLKTTKTPYGLVIKKGYFTEYLQKEKQVINNSFEIRGPYLQALNKLKTDNDLFIGTTGFSGREMHVLLDHNGKFYMMGSMGCAPSIGLGVALDNPDKKVFVIDGDGALLMKMGSLATVGNYGPKNLIHICFDNSQYESTGGQKTSAHVVDFSIVAAACGYLSTSNIDNIADFIMQIEKCLTANGPHFIHIKIGAGTLPNLPRPQESAQEMRDNFINFLTRNIS
ncbi:MAG: phosphonopyruvate decarboxylase [Magnetococcales bacterium]|nr:phosphonopyruvate decarboxylase [Magnetococcales bacterium]